MSYLREMMEACAAELKRLEVAPADCVLLAYAPKLETKINESVSGVGKVAVVLGKPSVTNAATDQEPDRHTGSFTVGVQANIVTSKYEASAVAESVYSALHKFNPAAQPLIPYTEIIARSMSPVSEGVYVVTFNFTYQTKQIERI